MARHATYPPSRLAILEECSCYWSDPDVISEVAEEGTLMHTAYETGDLSDLPEDEQREAVEKCRVYTESIRHSFPEDVEEYRELKVESPLTWGTADRVFISRKQKRAAILDAKFGRIPVDPAETNLQGQCYVFCLLSMYPELEEVELHFIQPRLSYRSTASFGQDDCSEIEARILKVIERAKAEDKEPTPSEKACRYCDRKASCSAVTELAMEITQKFAGLPSPSAFRPGEMVSLEDRAKAQVMASIMEDWATQVKKMNAQVAREEGRPPPGFDLRERHGGYKVENPWALLEEVAAAYALDPTRDLLPAIKVSLAELVKAVKLHRGGDAKEIKGNIVWEAGDKISEKPSIFFLQKKRGLSPEEIWSGESE